MRLLTREEYLQTFDDPCERVGEDESPPFDFWPYFEAIPAADFEGHDCFAGVVEYAWRMSTSKVMHVLVNSATPNVFMVLVLNLEGGVVRGHRLVDIKREYGVS